MMLTATTDLVNLGVGPAAIMAVLGYAVVFFGIVLLMIVVTIMGKIFIAQDAKKAAQKAILAEPVPVATSIAEKPVAPGTAGQLKTYDVEPKTCAMLMAIVADKMGKPLNELRFISIKEVN